MTRRLQEWTLPPVPCVLMQRSPNLPKAILVIRRFWHISRIKAHAGNLVLTHCTGFEACLVQLRNLEHDSVCMASRPVGKDYVPIRYVNIYIHGFSPRG